jgi:hypothetical protein
VEVRRPPGLSVGTHTLLTLAGFKDTLIVSKSLPTGAQIRATAAT